MGRRIPPGLCTRCKGYKKLCGLPYCPILERFRQQVLASSRITGSREVEGDSPPSIVVGEAGYPTVPILYNLPPEEHGEKARLHDAPLDWARQRLPLRTIISYRSSLVSGVKRVQATTPWKLYEEEISVAAVSTKPVQSRALLEKPPIPSLRFDGVLAPQGPAAPARKVIVESNPTLHPKLEKLIWDDARSDEAVYELYRSGVDVYTIVRAFSLGLLGRVRSRRLVPTRWSITAVDQIISTRLLHRVRTYDTLGRVEVYHAHYLGNYITVILFPGSYEAELIEVWHPLTPWTQAASQPVVYRVTESMSLKLSEMDGGYMAMRLPVAEQLHARRRQAKAIIVREITRDYYAPVGNWHLRETTRQALVHGLVATFDTLDEAIRYVSEKLLLSDAARSALHSSILARKTRSTTTLDMFLKR
ncbi:Nre family DNA repair protein [Hyperthermus butylicus]|uniref:DNA repair protein n=1 Tax=Hyperthermus butylicus (strain DSM 5456 / JCM 9403 / PLM1-5) TaxID=415426 RepID=A2BM41_HYPBU|nr:Nre family DNA repair protein [Hyperthermus butylicus]ABM81052.1 conserved archaeal protein [Hyperthermus butylicus DSM 5456]